MRIPSVIWLPATVRKRTTSLPWLPATAAALLAAVTALWFFESSYQFLDRYQYNVQTLLGPLRAGSDVVQTFRAPENGLSRIDLDLDLQPESREEVVLELYDLGVDPVASDKPPALENKVREIRKTPAPLMFSMLQRFSFDPIPDSAGRNYAIRLGLGGAGGGAPVEPKVSDADAYADGSLFVGDNPAGKDLRFALFHEDGPAGIFARIESFRPYPLNRSYFFTALLLGAAGSFGWLVRKIVRS